MHWKPIHSDGGDQPVQEDVRSGVAATEFPVDKGAKTDLRYTMSKLSWAEQCKDPRWQKKRLEIMRLAEFQCESCLLKTVTLNVHHGYYERGLAPWEYPNDTLFCLCKPCHQTSSMISLLIHRELGRIRPAFYESVLEYLKYKSARTSWPISGTSRYTTPETTNG